MSKRQMTLSMFFLFFIVFSCIPTEKAHANETKHIYVDQEQGSNSSMTTGSQTDPFKSITYAVLSNKDAEMPLFFHIKSGIYDTNPEKTANEREIFPIELKNNMTIQGDDGAENCIISGAFNTNSKSAIIRGDSVSDIYIKELTIKDITRSSGNGAGCELIDCSGKIEGCVFQNCKGSYSYSGALWMSFESKGHFDLLQNSFMDNSHQAIYAQTGYYGNISHNIFKNNRQGFVINGEMKGNIEFNLFINNQCYTNGAGFSCGDIIGNIFDNVFYSNTLTNNDKHGVGFYSRNITGNIMNNYFIENSVTGSYRCQGIGFFAQHISGNISGNLFSGNTAYTSYSSGFYISGILSGHINANIFSKNSGMSFYLASSSEEQAIIYNNFFVDNASGNISSGSAFTSKQNISLINNTFYGGVVDEPCIVTYHSDSNILNNIFANVHTAIFEPEEFDLIIRNNNFYNLTNILNRNNNPIGDDSNFIAMLLNNFSNNNQWSPGFIGVNISSGAFTHEPTFDSVNHTTILKDTNQTWTNDQWKNSFLNVSDGLRFLIVSNSDTSLTLKGNFDHTDLFQKHTEYSIDNFRLAENSQNRDSGTTGVVDDFYGDVRPWHSGFDIGADEYVHPLAPGIASVDPPAVKITLSSASLKALINGNSLTTTFYFEYGIDTNYGYTTSTMSINNISGLSGVTMNISDLNPETHYHFRLVATNSIGTTHGPDQHFTTQKTTCMIKGKVAIESIGGNSGLSVKNATVLVADQTILTDDDGTFICENIPPGDYTLTINALNLLPVIQQVSIEQSQVLNIGTIEMNVISDDKMAEIINNEREACMADAQYILENELKIWDINSDTKKGLPEAIDALKISAGIGN